MFVFMNMREQELGGQVGVEIWVILELRRYIPSKGKVELSSGETPSDSALELNPTSKSSSWSEISKMTAIAFDGTGIKGVCFALSWASSWRDLSRKGHSLGLALMEEVPQIEQWGRVLKDME